MTLTKNSIYLTILSCFAIVTMAACSAEVQVTPTPSDGIGGVANPAAVYCREQGHDYEIRTALTGDQYGVCLFDDGSECDAWAYFRGECVAGEMEMAPEPANAAVNIVTEIGLADTVAIDVWERDSASAEFVPLLTIEDHETIERLLQAINLDLPPKDAADCPTQHELHFRNADGEATPLGFACAGVTPTFLRGEARYFDGLDIIVPEEFRELLVAKIAAQTLAGNSVSFAGVEFEFDELVAGTVSAETVPGFAYMGAETFPDHLQFTFDDYAIADHFHDPRLIIYPIAQFDAESGIAMQITATLQQFLDNPSDDVDGMPFLPLFNAAQQHVSQVETIDFQNGRGVRYLTQFGQALQPVNNDALFYTFQGITNDGEQYVAAILPVTHPTLSDDSTIDPDEFDAFAENYLVYADEMETIMNGHLADSFTPDLTLLDAMMASLRTGEPTPEVVTAVDSAENRYNYTADAIINTSSFLPPDLAGTYHGIAAIDSLPETAWVEGVAGPGIGEWIQLDFVEPITIATIGVNPGYAASDELFAANNRVKTLTVQFVFPDGSTDSTILTLEDAPGVQLIDLPNPAIVRAVRLIIDDIYPGDTYDDTAIAEIELY